MRVLVTGGAGFIGPTTAATLLDLSTDHRDGDGSPGTTGSTHLIPLVLQVAAGTRAEVSIFGSDYPTP